jgi:sugar phosphate permease
MRASLLQNEGEWAAPARGSLALVDDINESSDPVLPLDDGHTSACFRKRNLIAVLMAIGMAQLNGLRIMLSVAVISISNEFGYSDAQIGLINAAFFIGYMPLNTVGGYLSMRYGGNWVMLVSLLIPSLLTMATPPFCGSIPGLIIMRILTGAPPLLKTVLARKKCMCVTLCLRASCVAPLLTQSHSQVCSRP